MLNQYSTAILVAIVGVLSTITGSLLTILGNYIIDKRNEKLEYRKLLYEKIEEIYVLSDQVSYLILLDLHRISSKVGLLLEIFGEHFYRKRKQEEKNLDLPLDRLRTLIDIYVPLAKPAFIKYTEMLQRVQEIDSLLILDTTKDVQKIINEYSSKRLKSLSELLNTKVTYAKGDSEKDTGATYLLMLQMGIAETSEALKVSLRKSSKV